jgi:hypothetical protein
MLAEPHRRDRERDSECIVMVSVLGCVAIFIAILATTGSTWTDHNLEHATYVGDELSCTVDVATCEDRTHSILYTWIVNASGDTGVIVELVPNPDNSHWLTCPDTLHPEGSTSACWKLARSDNAYGWGEHDHERGHGHDHGHPTDEVTYGTLATVFWILLLIVVAVCVPLGCLLVYRHDAGEHLL